MKVRAYVRVARLENGKSRLVTTSRPSNVALTDGYGDALPTVSFAVDFNVDDLSFRRASNVIAVIEVADAVELSTVQLATEPA